MPRLRITAALFGLSFLAIFAEEIKYLLSQHNDKGIQRTSVLCAVFDKNCHLSAVSQKTPLFQLHISFPAVIILYKYTTFIHELASNLSIPRL